MPEIERFMKNCSCKLMGNSFCCQDPSKRSKTEVTPWMEIQDWTYVQALVSFYFIFFYGYLQHVNAVKKVGKRSINT